MHRTRLTWRRIAIVALSAALLGALGLVAGGSAVSATAGTATAAARTAHGAAARTAHGAAAAKRRSRSRSDADGLSTPGGTPIYQNPLYSFAERAADLVSRMTLSQKASQMNSSFSPAIPSLGVPQWGWWNEALHGVARE